MNVLAVSNEASALLVAATTFIASVALAYWAYLKGAAGKQSENCDSALILEMDSSVSSDIQSNRAA